MDKKRGAYILVLVTILLIIVIFLFQNFKFVEKQGTQTTTTPATMLSKEEKDCLGVLAEYDITIPTMTFKDYVTNKHIDFSDGNNIKWKVAHSGEDANRFFIDTIPMYQNIVFLVTSKEFEGCGKFEYKEEIFVSDEYYSCKATFGYFISSSKKDGSSLLRVSTLIKDGISLVRIFHIKNEYYNNIYKNIMDEVNKYGCQKV